MTKELSEEEGALIGLSTLGPRNCLQPPHFIVNEEGVKTQGARSFDAVVLDALVGRGLAYKSDRLNGYALTQEGARRVLEILLIKTPMEPLDALTAVVKFGAAVGMRKEGDGFMVQIIRDGTSYLATDPSLPAAIVAAKAQMDRALAGL